MENKPRKWWIAGLLSLVELGLGQLYNGELKKAIIFYILSMLIFSGFILCLYGQYIGIFFIILMALIIITIAFTVFVFIDAVKTAKRFSCEYKLKKYNKASVYVVIIIISFAVSIMVELFDIHYLPKVYKLPSMSMEPTLLVGDRILVDRSPLGRNPQKSDVIIYEYPLDPPKMFIKRVVALGGETIEIKDKQLIVNGNAVNEKYIIHSDAFVYPAATQPRDNFGPVVIPADSFFEMGDNRDNSRDSRFYGPISKNRVKGTARSIFWSWDSENKSVRWNRIGLRVQ